MDNINDVNVAKDFANFLLREAGCYPFFKHDGKESDKRSLQIFSNLNKHILDYFDEESKKSDEFPNAESLKKSFKEEQDYYENGGLTLNESYLKAEDDDYKSISNSIKKLKNEQEQEQEQTIID